MAKPIQDLLEALPKVGRLNSAKSVRRELRKVYREMRLGRITPSYAGSCAYILSVISKSIETEMLESRLEAIEGRALLVGDEIDSARLLIREGVSGQFA